MYCPYLTRPPGYSVISADYFVSISLAKNVAVFTLKSTATKGKYFQSYPKSLPENVYFPELFYSCCFRLPDRSQAQGNFVSGMVAN